MGLREIKAARTRAQLIEVALDLFLSESFEATTMEQIAERAEVGTSTLYRYFPSKDLLILEPIIQSLDFADRLAERPPGEPLNSSLGAVIRASYPGSGLGRRRFAALRRLVDNAPGPRARLWDLVNLATRRLEAAIAERSEAPIDDLAVALAARMVLNVYELAGRAWTTGDSRASWERAVDGVLEAIADVDLIVPER